MESNAPDAASLRCQHELDERFDQKRLSAHLLSLQKSTTSGMPLRVAGMPKSAAVTVQ